METKQKTTVETQGVSRETKKTVSLTTEQLEAMELNPELTRTIISLIKNSDGNLKGNMAFNMAKMLIKQTKLKM